MQKLLRVISVLLITSLVTSPPAFSGGGFSNSGGSSGGVTSGASASGCDVNSVLYVGATGLLACLGSEIAYDASTNTLTVGAITVNGSGVNQFTGSFGIGAVPAYGFHYVGTSGYAIFADLDTNLAKKTARIGVRNYTNATAPLGIAIGISDSSVNDVYFGGGSSLVTAATNLHFYTASNSSTTTGTERAKLLNTEKFIVIPTAAQTIASGNTVTADTCGGFKEITSAGAVTTGTTNTFTAPSATNTGCVMKVCNSGANNITLDNNALFKSAGGADVVLTGDDCVEVGNNGTAWFQLSPVSVN